MAKQIVYTKEKSYPFPSQFGSHASMVDKDKTEALNSPGRVVCRDEYGFYETYANRLDSGEVDWHRANGERMKVEKEGKKK